METRPEIRGPRDRGSGPGLEEILDFVSRPDLSSGMGALVSASLGAGPEGAAQGREQR